MKLLFDQNLSCRLTRDIQGAFPDSQHVIHLNLTTEDDEILWKFAADNDFVIISKDSDFFHRALLHGHPPKVIYLRVGNCSTQHIKNLLMDKMSVIYDFFSDPMESLLILE
jgi:predicted nuclease of predicted toxin-antitoxin system